MWLQRYFMGKFRDLTGQRFGRLTVLSRAPNRILPSGKPKTMWYCKCDCDENKIIEVEADSLIRGNTTSCGCYRKEQALKATTKHGLSGTKLEKTYRNMHSRCENPNATKYEIYGGKGITVCDEWSGENGLVNFYNWAIANGYEEGLSIDRIDGDKGYSPDNCRWATIDEQNFNRSNTLLITIDGETKQAKDWAKEYGLAIDTFWQRYYKGITGKDLIDEPSMASNRNTSGVTGVVYRKDTGKWTASIDKDNVHYSLGCYTNKEDAIKARYEAELRLYGKYVNHVKNETEV